MGDGRVIAPLIRTPFLRKTVVAILFLEEVGPYVTLRPHLPPTPGEERRGDHYVFLPRPSPADLERLALFLFVLMVCFLSGKIPVKSTEARI